MPGFYLRFDIAAVLLASTLSILGISSGGANTAIAGDDDGPRIRRSDAAHRHVARRNGDVRGGTVSNR